MVDEYEITSSTLLLEYYDTNKTKVYELTDEFIVEQNILNIVENSCNFYGSSLEGRISASKKILGTNIKLPVVIEDVKKIIFFPTRANYQINCKWLSFNNIDRIEKIGKNNKLTRVFFCNGKYIDVKISYEIIYRQFYNCLLLEKTLLLRQESA